MSFRCGCSLTASTSAFRPLLLPRTRGGYCPAGAAGLSATRPLSLSRPLLKNHYETLGVKPSAKPAEIKSSFYALSRQWHPDKQGGSKASTHKFQEIAEAYGVLSDDTKRRDYDLANGLRPGGPRGTASNSYTSEQHWQRHHANQQQQWRGGNPFDNPFGPGSIPPHMRQKYRERAQFNFDEWYNQHYGRGPGSKGTDNFAGSDMYGRRRRPTRSSDKLTPTQELYARMLAIVVVVLIYTSVTQVTRYDRHGGAMY